MADKNSYSRARATKKSSTINASSSLSNKQQKNISKAIKKSPLLILAVVFLLIGVAGGYFAYQTLSPFEMNSYVVNGIISAENDYIIVDLLEIKEDYLVDNPTAKMEDVYNSIVLQDKGITCKFFGIDKSNTITTKYYYREDISKDVQEVDKIDIKTSGVYYIEYTSSFFAFKNSKLIRTIIITEVENDG